jgi:hypothetical protein
MPTIKEAAAEFLATKRVAVTGVALDLVCSGFRPDDAVEYLTALG